MLYWLTLFYFFFFRGYFGNDAQKDASLIVLAKSPVLVQKVRDVPDATIFQSKRRHHLHVKKASSRNELLPQNEYQPQNGNVDIYKAKEQSKKDFDISERFVHGTENRKGCCIRFPRLLFLLMIYFVMIMAWAMIYYWQRTGSFVCETIYTQFNDIYHPGLATFSGLYDVKCGRHGSCKRVEYVERGHGNFSATAKFYFCEDISSWVFAFSDTEEFSCDSWTAKSAQQNDLAESSYNIMESTQGNEGWSVLVDDRSALPLPTFTLECFDCRYDDDFCGGSGRGRCEVSCQKRI